MAFLIYSSGNIKIAEYDSLNWKVLSMLRKFQGKIQYNRSVMVFLQTFGSFSTNGTDWKMI